LGTRLFQGWWRFGIGHATSSTWRVAVARISITSIRAAAAALFVLNTFFGNHFIKLPRVISKKANILKEYKMKYPA
jgi:hypothetical protein